MIPVFAFFLFLLGEKRRRGWFRVFSLIFVLDQMSEGIAQSSRYVKLKKDQAPVEDITPGELNQPIEVPQVRSLWFLNCIALHILKILRSWIYNLCSFFSFDGNLLESWISVSDLCCHCPDYCALFGYWGNVGKENFFDVFKYWGLVSWDPRIGLSYQVGIRSIIRNKKEEDLA